MTSNPNITEKLITLIDDENIPYLAFNLLSETRRNRPISINATSQNICSFISETLQVGRVATGVFSTDLTDRDDVILAISSLMIILAIEGILTTILVRSYNGNVSNIGFSVKQFVELAREFQFRNLIRGRKEKGRNRSTRVNPKLLLIASVILISTFGLEVVILILTSPSLVDVLNTDTSFTLIDAINPDWNQVKNNIGAAINRPCTAITFQNVEQEGHQVMPCLTVNASNTAFDQFQTVTDPVFVNITTDIHEHGANHYITIGEHTLAYLSRCYFRLGDMRNRIMSQRVRMYNSEKRFAFIHKQYIAYLFNIYARQIPADTSMNMDRLEQLQFTFKSAIGPPINVIQINNRQRYRKVTSTRYTTTVTGVIPRGPAALQFAQAVLKASTGVAIRGPDQYDLLMGSGNTAGQEALMWRETSRPLNWVSINIFLALTVALFLLLRYLLKPVGTAEIAEIYVMDAVGATEGRPPAHMTKDEKEYFALPSDLNELDSCEEYSDVSDNE